MSTLVILGASITGLAVARDAHRHGMRAIVADCVDGPGMHSRCATAVPVPPADDARALESVLGLAGRQVALIASSDQWIRFIVEHRSTLDASFLSVLHPANDTLRLCLDKMAFAEWCVAKGLPTPAAWMPDREPRPAHLRFPLLLRPVLTQHGNRSIDLPKAVEAKDHAELDAWLQRYREAKATPLVTESLLGRALEQYSIPFACREGQVVLFTAHKVRPPAQLCQTGTCVQTCVDGPLEQLGHATLNSLDYFGVGELEVLRDVQSGRDYLIEINARPWLQYALAAASNHDLLGHVLGLPPINERPLVVRRKTWVDLHQDLFVAFSRSIGVVRNGQLGLIAYLKSVARCNVFALFDWRDPQPFLRSLLRR